MKPLRKIFENDKPTEWLSLDDYVQTPESHLLYVRVNGDSMAERDIHSGDLIVVDRNDKGRENDPILIDKNGVYTITVKTSVLRRGLYLVKPERKPPIDNYEIIGTVTHILKTAKRGAE